jgi:hypothetical protein
MIDNAVRILIHEVLDRMAGSPTPGAALDAIPDDWQRFISGPDEHGFHFSMEPPGAPDAIRRIYGRGLGMGRGASQMDAIVDGIAWIRERVPPPDDILGTLKERAIALTTMTDVLNDLYVRLEAAGSEEQARIVNAEVQRLASRADSAQYAILAHLERGDLEGWDESHPLNEALWSGQATPEQIREYA